MVVVKKDNIGNVFVSGAKVCKMTDSNSLVTKEVLEQLYREMLLIRRFEEKAGQLYGMGLIQGFCHLYIGQELSLIHI